MVSKRYSKANIYLIFLKPDSLYILLIKVEINIHPGTWDDNSSDAQGVSSYKRERSSNYNSRGNTSFFMFLWLGNRIFFKKNNVKKKENMQLKKFSL